MNKDLDDRLIPNGEYRDANNISVGKSEDDDIGALENILGNTLVQVSNTGNPNLEIIGYFTDNNNNVVNGDVVLNKVVNSYVYSSNRLVTINELSDLIVIDTQDALFYMDAERGTLPLNDLASGKLDHKTAWMNHWNQGPDQKVMEQKWDRAQEEKIIFLNAQDK